MAGAARAWQTRPMPRVCPERLISLLLVAPLLAAAASPEVKPVRPVRSGPEPRETPETAKIAPTSRLSPAIATFVAAKVAPAVEGTAVYTVVSSGSMRPAFDDNTVLLTEPAPFHELQVGDIVVYRPKDGGEPMAHRILERRDGGYWTKGDHNEKMDDELVTEKNYLGRVYGILFTSRSGKPRLPDALRKTEVPRSEATSARAQTGS